MSRPVTARRRGQEYQALCLPHPFDLAEPGASAALIEVMLYLERSQNGSEALGLAMGAGDRAGHPARQGKSPLSRAHRIDGEGEPLLTAVFRFPAAKLCICRARRLRCRAGDDVKPGHLRPRRGGPEWPMA